jgi:hypothetical protein
VNLGEIEEEWGDDLEAEMRTVAARRALSASIFALSVKAACAASLLKI